MIDAAAISTLCSPEVHLSNQLSGAQQYPQLHYVAQGMQQGCTAVDDCMMSLCKQGAALPLNPSTPAAGGRHLQLRGAAVVSDETCLCFGLEFSPCA